MSEPRTLAGFEPSGPNPRTETDPVIWAIVVAGGSGRRFGRPKQLEMLGGTRIIDRSIRAVAGCVTGVVVVGDADLGSADELGVAHRVDGGPTRSASVRSGLDAVPASATHVLIHDAARPLAGSDLVERVIAALTSGASAVVPVVSVTDSLRQRQNIEAGHTADPTAIAVDRQRFVAVQTPQGFDAKLLRQVHASGDDASDDATLVERHGIPVVQVHGDSRNFKITYPQDLQVAGVLLHSDPSTDSLPFDVGDRLGGSMKHPVRVGQGFDVHAFDPDHSRPLVLAGVRFDEVPGLRGHSDADVIAHACTDAILGAAGLGDIGLMFPDTDDQLAGADSITLLAEAVARVASSGWLVTNVDCTVILDRPKIAAHREIMERNLSQAVGAPVSVKGKRTEGVPGLGGGIQCHALALLRGNDRVSQ